MIFDIEDLNNKFRADTWLAENFDCTFSKSSNGFQQTNCPFPDHNDTNPSFGINLEKGMYKCFGCGRGGNFIDLISKLLDLDFYKSLLVIASYEGINIEDYNNFDNQVYKFLKATKDSENQIQANKRIIKKATHKIKKVLAKDFEKGDMLYKKLDELISSNDFEKIKELSV